MFEEERPLKVFVTTVRQVIENLSEIKDCPVSDFQEAVEDGFDGYHYEGEEEVIGFEAWEDISNDGEYQLTVKVDHEDAYEFTLYVSIKNEKATVNNVL